MEEPLLQAPSSFTATKDSPLPPPATHSPPPRRPTRVAVFCCKSIANLALYVVVVFVCLTWIFPPLFGLYIHPQQGTYKLADVNLKLFKLTHDTHTTCAGYSLDADVDLKLLFRNPNEKMGLILEGVTVQALGDVVAVPSFYQARGDERTVVVSARAVKRTLSESVGRQVLEQIDRNHIKMRVELGGRVRGDLDMFDQERRMRLKCVVTLMVPHMQMNQTWAVTQKKCWW